MAEQGGDQSVHRRPGDLIRLVLGTTIIRDGREMTVKATLAERVEDKDIQTVSYSMWIEQVVDREGQPTGETRYHVVNQVQVRLRDLTKTGELLQKALEAGANNVGGISFVLAGAEHPCCSRN